MIDAINSSYRDEPTEVELITRYFTTPPEGQHKSDNYDFMSSTDITVYLQDISGINNLNATAVGKAMQRLGFIQWQKWLKGKNRSLKGYTVIKADFKSEYQKELNPWTPSVPESATV